MQEKPVATVSLKDYKKLLTNAGFKNHKHLTGEILQYNEVNMVKHPSLGEAHRALEEKKKKENFDLLHSSSDEVRKGIKKLTEFLYNYKDYR